jgi:hypothetical protein
MNEIWVSIPGYADYLVSNQGRFKSLDRLVNCNKGKRLIKGKIHKPWINKHGYKQVGTYDRKHFNLHWLVAYMFCEGYQKGLVVNHKNGIKTDNRSDNLEWISNRENIIHAYRVLKKVPQQLGKFGKDHNASKPVVAVSLKTGEEIKFESGMDAIRSGVAKDSGSITRCCQGVYKSHNGYEFRYA